MINFSAHEVRAGKDGAREDFEQMIALLVQATHGEASMVFANPGDWGIDVLVGDLRGRVTIWQAKYFIRDFGESQMSQVRDSFASAVRHAAEHGYTVDRWVLCIPSSLDPHATRWWHHWKTARQRETGITIDLWHETKLRELLLTKEAASVRRHYYDQYRHDDPPGEPAESLPAPLLTAQPEQPWQGGAEYRLGGSVYLLHDKLSERASQDRSWVWREATADLIEPGAGRVRLRQVRVMRRVPAAEQQQAGLRAQAGLLAALSGRSGLPPLVGSVPEKNCLTVVTAHPRGAPWAEVLGPRRMAADPLTTARVLAAAAHLCGSLSVLHAHGTSHRALHPGAIFADGERCLLRDAGLAELPPSAGEGEAVYRAPEQSHGLHNVGAQTDVYQLAAIVYHTLTGHPPAPAGAPPVRAAIPGFPEAADRTLLSALGADPAQRPAGVRLLASALRAGRDEFSRAGRR